jgi:hypothetical protein
VEGQGLGEENLRMVARHDCESICDSSLRQNRGDTMEETVL